MTKDTQRVALGIEYDGTSYFGWQRQSACVSVQETVERALSKVADQSITLSAAGRTDAGVHALAQVAHFDTSTQRDPRAWLLGANTELPRDIAVKWVQPISKDFHSRYSAIARQYRYVIHNTTARTALLRHRAFWYYHALDAARMQEAAFTLVGEHDFSAFRAAQCQSLSTVRVVEFIRVVRRDALIEIDIKADAFLHHMVRNIVGSLIKVGTGECDVTWLVDVLSSLDRRRAGVTVPPQGLCMTGVFYPENFAIPQPIV